MKSRLIGLLSVLFLGVAAWAESPVSFADSRLRRLVENELWVVDPTPTDMLGLMSLQGLARGITSLEGLQYAHNLQILAMRENEISDLTPLSGLTNLVTLNLSMNQISDLSPLSGLVNLRTLDLHDNPGISNISAVAGMTSLETIILRFDSVSDVSPLAGLSHLRHADLWENLISDISPLLSLTSLSYLDLRYNPLDPDACSTYIPQIQENNPGENVAYSGCTNVPRPRQVVLSSTAGGAVTNPGEGQFTFQSGTVLWLSATADPGYVFAGWSGSVRSPQNPISITLTDDVEIRANFASPLMELWVDDDAFNDPAPQDSALSDPAENGTPEHPFDRIQKAIEVAQDGATVFVRPGIYRENIDTLSKSVHLIGMDPARPNAGPCAIVEGTGAKPVVYIAGSSVKCSLTGFVITRGSGPSTAALHCDGSSPIITHCLIVGNRGSDPNGAVVYFRDSKAILANCTLADNYPGVNGAGLLLIDSNVTVTDSILWNNGPLEVRLLGTSAPTIRSCDVRGWWPDYGNFSADPQFARHGRWVSPADPSLVLGPEDNRTVWTDGDYHLQSQVGRWDPVRQFWVSDATNSPCIDGGDKTTPVGSEPAPNGGRINLGAYGGTTEASKSPLGSGI